MLKDLRNEEISNISEDDDGKDINETRRMRKKIKLIQI